MQFITNQQAGISDDEFDGLSVMEKANFAAACGRLTVYEDFQALADKRFPEVAEKRRVLTISG